MFEKTSRLAELMAASVSRRSFLGSLGGWAAAAAMGVAGMLTEGGTARAAQNWKCCSYASGQVTGKNALFGASQPCPSTNCQGYLNSGYTLVHNPNQCCSGGNCC
jgi:hypothetical protein